MQNRSLLSAASLVLVGLTTLVAPVSAEISDQEPNSPSNPQNIGTLSSSLSVRGIVHTSRDVSDVFKLRLGSRDTIQFRLQPDANASLYVYTDNGDCQLGSGDSVRSSRNPGSQAENITLEGASAGCYFVKVLSGGPEFTGYSLNITKGSSSPTPPPAEEDPPICLPGEPCRRPN